MITAVNARELVVESLTLKLTSKLENSLFYYEESFLEASRLLLKPSKNQIQLPRLVKPAPPSISKPKEKFNFQIIFHRLHLFRSQINLDSFVFAFDSFANFHSTPFSFPKKESDKKRVSSYHRANNK